MPPVPREAEREVVSRAAVALTFDGVAPLSGAPGDVLTVSARGLDPDPSHGRLIFKGTWTAEVEAPLLTVDVAQNRATVAVPEGATTGAVELSVNGQLAPQSFTFTVRGPLPYCGYGGNFLSRRPK